jgi:septal ring factor EnvC (AmiA/AmiB activator)
MADWKKYSQGRQEPDPEVRRTEVNPSSGSMLTWILGGLIAVAAIFAIYFGFRSNDYQNRSANLEAELESTRTDLEGELVEVRSAYDTQLVMNEGLTAEIETRVAEVEDLQNQIASARRQLATSKANTEEIRSRLAEMEELKAALETDLASLQMANDSLYETNSSLAVALDESKMQVEQMSTEIENLNAENQRLDRRLTLIAPAGFKAENFRISVERRNDKLTSKARRADEVVVRFDLDNVPAEKQGQRELYLTVTELNGNPITIMPVEQVSVPAANEPLQISAADIEQVDLSETQTVAMSFRPDRDLEAGEYNIFVYSDAGYLGATGFRLR